MIRGRTPEQWKRSFQMTPQVSYAEAVLWIFYRDIDGIADCGMVADPTDYAEESVSMVEAVATGITDPYQWQDVGPQLALLDALAAGQVQATGRKVITPHSIGPSRETIIVRDIRERIGTHRWADMAFSDEPRPFDKATNARRKNARFGDGGWTDILFDRAGLIAAFPGKGVNQVVSLVAGGDDDQANSGETDSPAVVEFSEKSATLSAALAAIRLQGLEPSKGNLALECARLYRARFGEGKSRAKTVEGMAQGIERQWARPPRQRSLEWLIKRAEG